MDVPRETALDELRVLGLTEAEEKVLEGLLGGGTQSVSALSRRIILPRTTVDACLRRLHERGLVRHVDTRYRSLWKVVGREKLQRQLWQGLSCLNAHLSKDELSEKIGINVSENTEFFAFQGVENMLKLYSWFFLNHFGQRVRGIQSNSSSQTILKKLDSQKVAQINDSVKQNRLIIDAILPESITEVYRSAAADPALLESVAGRTTAVHLVPNNLLQFNADLLLGRNVAIFANWEVEVAVLIRNPEFLKLLSNLYDVMAHIGKSFDQNAFVRSLIENQEKTV